MQLAKTASSRVAVARPCPARVARVFTRATPSDDQSSAPAPGTIFYGGKSYSEAEYEQARQNGSLMQPAPVSNVAYTSSGIAAMPTFNDVMGFSGTAPEIVNGRLAMLGFVSAVAAELSSGDSVLKQWAEEPTGIAAAFMLIIAGSLVPAFLGNKQEKLGPLTPTAELINGRAAMIGFAAMLIIEAVKGSTLF